MKKALSTLLALVLMLTLAVPAFAADTLTGSITINNSDTVSVENKTFNAYQVLGATFVNGSDAAQGVAYTVPAALNDFYADRYTLDASAPDFGAQVAAKIADEPDMFVFATDVLAAAKAAGLLTGTATGEAEAESVSISNLPFGYYVVEDVGAAMPISALMLDTVGTVTVTLKADKPALDKKIDGDKDTDPSTVGKVETNNAAIGDKVPYELTSKVPDMTGYKKYFFVVTDTLSKGLVFGNDVKVTIGEQDVTRNVAVTSAPVAETGETTVKIVFNNFLQYQPQKGEPIVITYSATVDKDAVIGSEGNPNKAHLDYSHNPNIIPQGENEPTPDDKEKNVTGETPDEMTKTFVTELELTKENEDHQALTGAEFKLEGDRLNTVLVTGDRFEKDAQGTYYLLKSGAYTTAVPNEHTNKQYASTTEKYRKVTETTPVTKTEHVEYRGFVNAQGKLTFTGLSAGEYVLTELVAPNGYNMLPAPITISIGCTLPENAAGSCTWTVNLPSTTDGNTIKLTVVNTTGSELPSTGGIGTTIFYVVGGLLMAGAIVLLITKKRMSSKDD